MLLLSVDVGIRNLSYCLLDGQRRIRDWRILDLTRVDGQPCCRCAQTAQYTFRDQPFCKAHAKAAGGLVPDRGTPSRSLLARKPLDWLQAFAQKHSVAAAAGTTTKTALVAALRPLYAVPLSSGRSQQATRMPLDRVVRNLVVSLDRCEALRPPIDRVVVEQQMKARMISLSTAILAYFLARGVADCSLFCAQHKLRGVEKEKKRTYAQRKRQSVELCAAQCGAQEACWQELFRKSGKKDDLSDCFLQGVEALSPSM